MLLLRKKGKLFFFLEFLRESPYLQYDIIYDMLPPPPVTNTFELYRQRVHMESEKRKKAEKIERLREEGKEIEKHTSVIHR